MITPRFVITPSLGIQPLQTEIQAFTAAIQITITRGLTAKISPMPSVIWFFPTVDLRP